MSSEKDFRHKLAMFVVGFSCLIVLLLFFVEVPESNQRIVDMVLGVIVGSGLVSVINYFFLSSPAPEDVADKM
tara:strand:+ start:290 stop:508 length:219 start_codon:yes stop_codon:yes gene_type:complete